MQDLRFRLCVGSQSINQSRIDFIYIVKILIIIYKPEKMCKHILSISQLCQVLHNIFSKYNCTYTTKHLLIIATIKMQQSGLSLHIIAKYPDNLFITPLEMEFTLCWNMTVVLFISWFQKKRLGANSPNYNSFVCALLPKRYSFILYAPCYRFTFSFLIYRHLYRARLLTTNFTWQLFNLPLFNFLT